MSKAVTLVTEDYGGGLPDNYDPQKGVMKVAAAEEAVKRFRRAKDAAGLYAAVEVLLGEKRHFVIWWDQQEKGQGERNDLQLRSGSGTKLHPVDFGLDRKTIFNWRQRYKDGETYKRALEAAQERCRQICEAEKGSSSGRGEAWTGETEWFTPARWVEAAREALGAIDLDPASSAKAQETIGAARFFTREEDGLAQAWKGRVFLNPPYAQPAMREFVAKLVAEHAAGNVSAGILLSHNYTDTGWFQQAAEAAAGVCFPRERVKFYNQWGEVSDPTQGQAFFYFGADIERFEAVFSRFGMVVEVTAAHQPP